jgi:hypothetical protein
MGQVCHRHLLLATNPDAATVCYTECYRGGRLVEDQDEVADMVTTVSMVRAAALAPRASLELMGRVRSELDEH